jgi:hypothetical protein
MVSYWQVCCCITPLDSETAFFERFLGFLESFTYKTAPELEKTLAFSEYYAIMLFTKT